MSIAEEHGEASGQDLLDQLGNSNNEDVSTRHLNEKVTFIEKGLDGLKNSVSRIEGTTRGVVERLGGLQERFRERPFTHQNLDVINADVMEVQDFIISMEDSAIARKLLPPKQSQTDDSGGDQATNHPILSPSEGRLFEEEAMSQFSASFNCLEPPEVKMCLLSLLVFPTGVWVKKRPLFYWWMGEGLLTKMYSEQKTAESVAEEVFQDLLNEGFIQAGNSKPDQGSFPVKSFRLYPWVRPTLTREAKRYKFLWPVNGDRNIYDSSLRTFLPRGKDDNASQTKARDVWTVLNLNEQYIRITEKWLDRQRKLEVLQLGRWQICPKHHIEVSNPDVLNRELGSQTRLKYLSLRGVSQVETLPESMARLTRLEILDLRACHNLGNLPRSISALKNLTHLDVSECYMLENMPQGLEQLRQLQVLKGFVIGKEPRNSCRIDDLERFQQLRKLSIRVIGNDGTSDQLKSIKGVSNLKILVLSWGFHSDGQVEQPMPVLLPEGLIKLDLRFVPFTNLPEGIHPKELPQLERLYIYGGKLSTLTSEDTPWNLAKFVRLQYLEHLILNEADLFPNCPCVVRTSKASDRI